jgi:hypothetical protein
MISDGKITKKRAKRKKKTKQIAIFYDGEINYLVYGSSKKTL